MFGDRKYPLMFNADWDDCGSSSVRTETITVVEKEYIATDGKYIYRLESKGKSQQFKNLGEKEPRIILSNFEGCPHWYGDVFIPNGDGYELQCKITKKYLEDAHNMKGDWTGYKEGDWTNRFLSKSSILSAFNLFKEIL